MTDPVVGGKEWCVRPKLRDLICIVLGNLRWNRSPIRRSFVDWDGRGIGGIALDAGAREMMRGAR